MTGTKHYLGDAVYVEHDGYYLVLTAENGVKVDTIYLEPTVYRALEQYVKQLLSQDGKVKP